MRSAKSVFVVGALLTAHAITAQAATISGQIRYSGSGLPVPGVSVRLLGPAPASTQTDATGHYAFSGVSLQNQRVEPEKLGDLGNGSISALDAAVILRSLVGLDRLNGQQQLAADVTGNGNVSALDAQRIQLFLVGQLLSFPVWNTCGQWAFVPAVSVITTQHLINPDPSQSPCQNGAIVYEPLAGDEANQDFLAVLFGDATANWPGPPTSTPSPTSTGTATPTISPTVTPTLPPWPTITLTASIGGFTNPVHINNAHDGSGRLFVVDQDGHIKLIKGGALQGADFLDIHTKISCCGERGLLSVAFPPGFASKKHFYVYYTNTAGNIVVARYGLTANPDVADPNSEEIVLTINHPFNSNHNGGQAAFGPDGYLYLGPGDGGGAGDVPNNAQNPASMLGKLIRIDVEAPTPTGTPTPYAIPTTNPTQTPGRPGPLWALGLRNPWRFAFDRQTGDLYIGDVGQNTYEEIDFQPAGSAGGQNYGWHIMEGFHCFNPPTGCDMTGLTLPVQEYTHDLGCAVVGGFVYRAATFPCMHGVYFYSDNCSGRIWGMRRSGATWTSQQLLQAPFNVASFGEDESGNLWITDYNDGNILKLVDACVAATLTPTPTPTPGP